MIKSIQKIALLSTMVVTLHAMENKPYTETMFLKHPLLKQFALRNPKLVAVIIIALPMVAGALIEKKLEAPILVKTALTVGTGIGTALATNELFGRANPIYRFFDWLYTKRQQ